MGGACAKVERGELGHSAKVKRPRSPSSPPLKGQRPPPFVKGQAHAHPLLQSTVKCPPWGKGGLGKVKAGTWGALYFLWRTSPALSKLRLCTGVRCRDNVNRAWTRAAQNANLARDMTDYLLPIQQDMLRDLRLD